LDICKNAVNNLGVVGIKMYPAHGYSLDPFNYLDDQKDRNNVINADLKDKSYLKYFDPVGQSLINFYIWADYKALPITVHSQFISMQKINKDDVMCEFNHPKHWINVLKNFKNIRVNFAHCGGSEYSIDCNQNSLSCFTATCNEFNSGVCSKSANNEERKFAFDCLNSIITIEKNQNLNANNRISILPKTLKNIRSRK